MAYQIIGFTTSQVTGDKIIHILCDTPTDLPSGTISGDYGGPVVQGCSAKIISTGDTYVADSSGTWVLQPGSAWTNVYSKSEVDALLAGLNILTRADLYRGYQIEANTDVNTLTDYGTYYCDSGTTAATLTNCPITGSGFIMTIFSNGNRVRMFYAVSANYPRMLIQARTGSVWRTIREFAMLDDIDRKIKLSQYSLEVGSFNDTTGEPSSSNTRIRTNSYISLDGAASVSVDAQINGTWLQTYYYFYATDNSFIGHGTAWRDHGICEPVPSGATKVRVIMRNGSNVIAVSDLVLAEMSLH